MRDIKGLNRNNSKVLLDAIVEEFGGQYTDDTIVIGATCVSGTETVLIADDEEMNDPALVHLYKSRMWKMTISENQSQFSEQIYEFANKYLENFLSPELKALLK